MAPLASLPKPLRALLDDADFAGQEPVVFCGNCSPVTLTAGGCTDNPTYLCEAAGRRFTARYEARSSSEDDDADDDDDDYDDADVANKEKYGSGKKDKNKEKTPGSGGALKMSEALKGVNLYELISTTEGASQDEIKKAYRQMALTCHPDKQAQLEPAEQKKVAERFVMIQEAYELLSDPAKRMQYDSGLDFDDSLPKFKEGKQDFFEVFGEAFRRNARFSIRRPVPEVGSLKDTPGQWKKFYDFWFDFQSWRDPVILAENGGEEIHDLGAADCREEKRWMMKENARAAKHYKKEEVERIQKLVSLAESFDPRVLAEKEAKKAARAADAAKRDEERNAHKRARDEVQRLQQEAEEVERVAEEQKKKEEKVAREAIKERVKKCRQRVRSFHPSVKEHVVLEQLNEVCLQFEEQALKDLADGIDKALKKKGAAAAESAAALIYKAIESIGLTPIQVVEEDASTSGGPPSQEAVIVVVVVVVIVLVVVVLVLVVIVVVLVLVVIVIVVVASDIYRAKGQ
ncbi:unnamed protein product [Polarella glacialis]|uniref:J domain-containing protein n=1 Tax=Polarella glacialis TaxID=89957 RepID=A0A813IAW3_POLGL|nr:unnamed protein product [Polarella glacialis]